MGLAVETGTKHPVGVLVVLKKWALDWLAGIRCWARFRYAHGYKPARCVPTIGLVDATIELGIFVLPGAIPSLRIKRWLTAPVGDDKIKSTVHCRLDALPAKKFTVGPEQHVLNTARKAGFDLNDESSYLRAGHGLAFSQFAQQIFSGLGDKAKDWPIALLASVFAIMPLARALLVAVKGFNGGVDIDIYAVVVQFELFPHSFAQGVHDFNQRHTLVDTHIVHISPERAGDRQPFKAEKAAHDSVEPDVGKMPQAVKADKQ